ncbi:MAG: FAD-dependent oxidoreductase, partial [Halieaceae bacterium]|nr:FAD-dependent oxidoreductase [Halieaceae bacterium]
MSDERQENLKRLDGAAIDVLVIGGGINGAVAAAALAGQGVRVALVEAEDFASGVSSESSNLAWGGIKYLESREFGLVRKLCRSRNRLMDAYPANVREIRFFTSIRRGFRFWPVFVWLGAVLYWLMGNGRLRFPRYLNRRRIAAEAPEVAVGDVVGGLEYSDCYLVENDARFVFRFVRQAMDAGALAANYLSVESLHWSDVGSEWQVCLKDQTSGDALRLRARAIVNATGPNADSINQQVAVKTQYHHM